MRRLLDSRLASALSQLRRSERGIALPMAMMITVIAMGFAAVPIMASINSQGADTRNHQGNEALAAAEAGAELAVLRQSQQLINVATRSTPCVSPGTLTGGWCTQTTGTIGEAEYRYRLRPCYVSGTGCSSTQMQTACEGSPGNKPVQVISTGFADAATVVKRVELLGCANESTTASTPPVQVTEKEIEKETLEKALEKEAKEGKNTETVTSPGESKVEEKENPAPNIYAKGQIVGINWLNMNNNAQVYNGGTGSNGWVSMVGSANVCGTVSYGTTFSTDNSSSNKAPSNCASGRKTSQGTTEYPTITLPTGIATNNSDSRLASADPVGPNVWQRGNISWNPSNRSLTVSYDQLTLEGTLPYYLCKLTLAGGSKLLAGAGRSIKIYFDAPENCPGLNGGAQLQIANGAYVGPDSANGPQFLFLGSATENASLVELGGGATVSQFVVYAPRSKVVANNGVNLNGVIIGRTLELAGGASINRSGAFVPPSSGEYLPPTKVTTTITKNGTTITTTSKQTKQNEETLIKVSKELEVLHTQYPSTTTTTVSAVDRGRFVECSSDAAPATPDAGC